MIIIRKREVVMSLSEKNIEYKHGGQTFYENVSFEDLKVIALKILPYIRYYNELSKQDSIYIYLLIYRPTSVSCQ